jgi:hypothetical protein
MTDIFKALAVLAESGITLTKEQQKSLDDFKAATLKAKAIEVFDKKGIDGVADSSEWVEWSFGTAALVFDQIVDKNVGRGRGEVNERVFTVETPHGTLKVSLTNSTE